MMISPPAPLADDIALTDQVDHLVRRVHQLAVALFHEKLGRDVTPVQYAVLRALEARPGIDQVTLAAEIALDTSTTAETAVRLERKGRIVRELLARRQRALYLTPEGQVLLAGLREPMATMQAMLLSTLEPGEQQELMRLLRKLLLTPLPSTALESEDGAPYTPVAREAAGLKTVSAVQPAGEVVAAEA